MAPIPITSLVDSARKVVFATCTGVLTIAEIAEHCVRLAQDPAFDPEFSLLNDLSGVSEINAPFHDLQAFVTKGLDPFSETSRRAFVATDPHVFGMARMYEGLIDHTNFVVVRTLGEGRLHLGLEPETTARS
jgi:hypothetical protein